MRQRRIMLRLVNDTKEIKVILVHEIDYKFNRALISMPETSKPKSLSWVETSALDGYKIIS